jgi:uncharacterized membrane protein
MWVISIFAQVVITSVVLALIIYGIWRATHPGQKW